MKALLVSKLADQLFASQSRNSFAEYPSHKNSRTILDHTINMAYTPRGRGGDRGGSSRGGDRGGFRGGRGGPPRGGSRG